MTAARAETACNGNALPTVSIVIPVRNGARHLQCCLKTIAATVYPPSSIEVVVVDNGSTDGSDEVARQGGARLLRLPGKRVSELRNSGAAVARGSVLAFVDADHEITPEWVRSAVETLQMPDVAAVGALCHAPPDGTWVQRVYDTLRARRPGRHEVEWLGSGNLAVRRETFDQVGGFDPTLEACEDVDLCRRLRASGYRVMHDDRLKSIHLGDPATLGQIFRSELWRGRDNVRASLRRPLSVRGLPSVAIPVVDLGCMALGILGLVMAPVAGPVLTLAAVVTIAGLASLRAARMIANGSDRRPIRAAQAFIVACVYDCARALALVCRAGHHRARAEASTVR